MSDAEAPAPIDARRSFLSIETQHDALAHVAHALATLAPDERHDFIDALNVLIATAALLEGADS